MFFQNCSTVEDIKITYRNLVKVHHPDVGGDIETMKRLNLQYHECLRNLDNTSRDGHTYKYKEKTEQEIMDIISKLIRFQELDISLIGHWIWIGGYSKKYREELKELNCIWHTKRQLWYWKPAWSTKYRSSTTKKYSSVPLEVLARKYGYKNFKDETRRLSAS